MGGSGEMDESRLGGDLTLIRFAPLNEVLFGAAAVVHHGGIGTAAAALERGVPQVAIPRVFMQPMNAERFAPTGRMLRGQCASMDDRECDPMSKRGDRQQRDEGPGAGSGAKNPIALQLC